MTSPWMRHRGTISEYISARSKSFFNRANCEHMMKVPHCTMEQPRPQPFRAMIQNIQMRTTGDQKWLEHIPSPANMPNLKQSQWREANKPYRDVSVSHKNVGCLPSSSQNMKHIHRVLRARDSSGPESNRFAPLWILSMPRSSSPADTELNPELNQHGQKNI